MPKGATRSDLLKDFSTSTYLLFNSALEISEYDDYSLWGFLVFLYVYSAAERDGKTLGSHNLRDRCAPILDDFPPATHDEE